MRAPRFKSIRSRLTLWYALVLGVIFLTAVLFLYRGFQASLQAAIDTTLQTAAEETELAILKTPPEKWQPAIKQVERAFLVNRLFIQVLEIDLGEEVSFRLVARSGVLAGNISQRKIWERLNAQLPDQPVYMNVNEESPSEHPFRIVLYPVKREKDKAHLIEVGTSLIKISSILHYYLTMMLVSAPLMLLLSVIGGYLILSRALLPVKSVVQTANRITTEDLSLRIETRNRKDEIGQLITTFNQMIARLEQSIFHIKRFASDASHDLKTPLTVIRGEIDIAMRKERDAREYKTTLATILDETRRLERVIDNLLFLSRIDALAHRVPLERVGLDEVVLEVFEKTQPLALKKGVTLGIEAVEAAIVNGDAILLNRLVMNLLDNALKYTSPGGRVEISLVRSGERALFTVKDTGIGIPEEALPLIFNPFYRVDQSRSERSEGSGLGLSIVKKIADIHKAEIEVHSQPDRGTTVVVSFPFD